MRYFIVKDKQYRLNEKNYKMLLKRLDPDRAIHAPNSGKFEIYEKCICPSDDVSACLKCELGRQGRKVGAMPFCLRLLFWVTLIREGDILYQINWMRWREDEDKKVRAELSKLRKKMLAIPKER